MANQRHDINVVHNHNLPDSIWLDRGRISQGLNNLLNNAIKYSPRGGAIKLVTSTDQDYVTVSVVDQGLGMSADKVEHIFDRFYRGDFEDVETSGLGLGMSIVKQLVTDHGGKIFVTSQLGEGTTVTFTLPIKRES